MPNELEPPDELFDSSEPPDSAFDAGPPDHLFDAPNMSVGAPAQIQVPQPRTPQEMGPGSRGDFTRPDLILKKHIVDPLVEGAQRHLTGPIAEAQINSPSKLFGPLEEAMVQGPPGGKTEAQKQYERGVLSWMLPPESKISEESYKPAADELERNLGVTGAAAAQSFGQGIGELPLYLAPVGRIGEVGKAAEKAVSALAPITKLAKVAPTIAKVLSSVSGGVAEGGAFGAAQGAVTPGADPLETAAYGAALGGGLKGLGEVAPLAMEEVRNLTGELLNMSEARLDVSKVHTGTVEGIEQAAVNNQKMVKLSKVGPDFVPATGAPVKLKNGQLVVRYFEINADGTFRYADIPANTPAALKAAIAKFPEAHFQASPAAVGATPELTARTGNALFPTKSINGLANLSQVMGHSDEEMASIIADIDASREYKSTVNEIEDRAGVDKRQAAAKKAADRIRKANEQRVSTPESEAPTRAGRVPQLMPVADEAGHVELAQIAGAEPAHLEPGGRAQIAEGAGHREVVVKKGTPLGMEVQDPENGVSFTVDPESLRAIESMPAKGAIGGTEMPAKLKRFGVITNERMQGFYGDSPADAHRRIKALVKSGDLIPWGEGRYKVTSKPYEPPVTARPEAGPNGIEPGRFVYYGGSAGEGNAAIGVYRGMRNGKYVVETAAPGRKAVELTRQQFNSALPSDFGDAKLLKVIGQEPGFTAPLQGGIGPQTLVRMQDVDNKLRQVRQSAPYMLQKMGKDAANKVSDFLIGPAAYGPELKRESLYALKATPRNRGGDMRDITAYLQENLQNKELLTSSADKARLPYANWKERQAIWQRIKQNNPQIAQGILDETERLIAEKDMWSREIARRGLGNYSKLETMRALGDTDMYAANMHASFELGEDWAKMIAKSDPWLKARDRWMGEWQQHTGEILNGEQAEKMLLEAIHAPEGPADFLSNRATKGTSAKGALKARKVVSPEMQQLLGKIASTPMVLGRSISNQRNLINFVNTWDTVAGSPHWSRDTRGPGWLQVPNEPIYGSAKGGFVAPELKALLDPDMFAHAHNTVYQGVQGIWKTMVTVLNPGSHLNNLARSLRGFMFNGVYENPEPFVRASKLWATDAQNPGKFGAGQLLHEARHNGALPPSYASASAGLTDQAIKRRLATEFAQQLGTKKNWAEVLIDLPRRFKDWGATGNQKLRHLYEHAEMVGKLGSYIKAKEEALAKGLTHNEAAAAATRQVNDTWPNYDARSGIAQMASQAPGVAAPFLHATMEDKRVWLSAAARAAKGDPKMMQHLLVFAGAMAAGVQTARAIRKEAGITDQMVDAAWQLQPQYKQMRRAPFNEVAPFVDKKGRLVFLDLANMFEPELNITAKAPDETYIQNALRYAVREGLAETPAELAQIALEKSQVLNPHTKMQINSVGQAAAQMVPGAVSRGARAYQKTEDLRKPTDEAFTPGEALAYGSGLPIAGVYSVPGQDKTTPNEVAAAQELKGQGGDLKSRIRQMIMNMPTDLTPEQRREFLDKVRQEALKGQEYIRGNAQRITEAKRKATQ